MSEIPECVLLSDRASVERVFRYAAKNLKPGYYGTLPCPRHANGHRIDGPSFFTLPFGERQRAAHQ